ncbi:MAG: hypothetical protein ACRCYQ_06040 [Nocardioides sp.]
MTVSVLLAVQEPPVAAALRDVLEADQRFSVRATAGSPDELVALALDHEPDTVVLHEAFGPAPALEIARDLIERLPWMSVVLLTREPSVELSGLAADVGVRSLVTWPISVTDLATRLTSAARISRAIRMGSEARADVDEPGLMVTLAGSKGGVGVTTLTSQLAFIAGAKPDRRICLVDLDFFGGDLAGYLGCGGARSILDLREVSDELSPGVLQPLLYPHDSGIRVLFAPDDIADGELVTESLVRRTLAVLRTMFDVVLVDVGCRMTEAALPAIELADKVVVVVTPDLTSLRQAHRLSDGWESLDVRGRATELVINRTSRGTAVQPRLVGQVSALPVCRVSIPVAEAAMERLANEGATGLRSHRSVARPLERLAEHLGLVPRRRGWFAPLWKRGLSDDDNSRNGVRQSAENVPEGVVR